MASCRCGWTRSGALPTDTKAVVDQYAEHKQTCDGRRRPIRRAAAA